MTRSRIASKVTGVGGNVDVPAVVLVVVAEVAAAEVVVADRDVEVVGFAVDGGGDSLRGHTANTNAPRMATRASAASAQGHRDAGLATCTDCSPSVA